MYSRTDKIGKNIYSDEMAAEKELLIIPRFFFFLILLNIYYDFEYSLGYYCRFEKNED